MIVLQRKASMQQNAFLLVPVIKGDMYINTHCNYSQPASIKLYNENIGGHLTPLHNGMLPLAVYDGQWENIVQQQKLYGVFCAKISILHAFAYVTE